MSKTGDGFKPTSCFISLKLWIIWQKRHLVLIRTGHVTIWYWISQWHVRMETIMKYILLSYGRTIIQKKLLLLALLWNILTQEVNEESLNSMLLAVTTLLLCFAFRTDSFLPLFVSGRIVTWTIGVPYLFKYHLIARKILVYMSRIIISM